MPVALKVFLLAAIFGCLVVGMALIVGKLEAWRLEQAQTTRRLERIADALERAYPPK